MKEEDNQVARIVKLKFINNKINKQVKMVKSKKKKLNRTDKMLKNCRIRHDEFWNSIKGEGKSVSNDGGTAFFIDPCYVNTRYAKNSSGIVTEKSDAALLWDDNIGPDNNRDPKFDFEDNSYYPFHSIVDGAETVSGNKQNLYLMNFFFGVLPCGVKDQEGFIEFLYKITGKMGVAKSRRFKSIQSILEREYIRNTKLKKDYPDRPEFHKSIDREHPDRFDTFILGLGGKCFAENYNVGREVFKDAKADWKKNMVEDTFCYENYNIKDMGDSEGITHTFNTYEDKKYGKIMIDNSNGHDIHMPMRDYITKFHCGIACECFPQMKFKWSKKMCISKNANEYLKRNMGSEILYYDLPELCGGSGDRRQIHIKGSLIWDGIECRRLGAILSWDELGETEFRDRILKYHNTPISKYEDKFGVMSSVDKNKIIDVLCS